MSDTPANEDIHLDPASVGHPADPVEPAKIDQDDQVEPTQADQTSVPVRKVDPMQGMKLETILQELVAYFGWEEMGYRINIRCFNEDPSIGSSLKFLRKTPWARKKVDTLFLTMRAEQSELSEQAVPAE
jgi:DNA-binding protein VF530